MDQPAQDSPILLFDSGVGGLTVLGELRELLPQAPVIYAADMAGLPYGAKSEAEIAARVAGLLGRMAERYQPRLICIACNTASTIALGMVRDVLETPIVGTVPAIKPAAKMTRTGVIGLLGTEATMRQAYVDELEREFVGDCTLLRYGANNLVALGEAKLRGESVASTMCRPAGLVLQPREPSTRCPRLHPFPAARGRIAAGVRRRRGVHPRRRGDRAAHRIADRGAGFRAQCPRFRGRNGRAGRFPTTCAGLRALRDRRSARVLICEPLAKIAVAICNVFD